MTFRGQSPGLFRVLGQRKTRPLASERTGWYAFTVGRGAPAAKILD
jgi:hypothetical protein